MWLLKLQKITLNFFLQLSKETEESFCYSIYEYKRCFDPCTSCQPDVYKHPVYIFLFRNIQIWNISSELYHCATMWTFLICILMAHSDTSFVCVPSMQLVSVTFCKLKWYGSNYQGSKRGRIVISSSDSPTEMKYKIFTQWISAVGS